MNSRRHHDVRGAVAPGGLELGHHLPGSVALHAFVGKRWARDVAAQLLDCMAVIGAAAHCGVQAEAGHKGPQGALCLPNAKARYKRLG